MPTCPLWDSCFDMWMCGTTCAHGATAENANMDDDIVEEAKKFLQARLD